MSELEFSYIGAVQSARVAKKGKYISSFHINDLKEEFNKLNFRLPVELHNVVQVVPALATVPGVHVITKSRDTIYNSGSKCYQPQISIKFWKGKKVWLMGNSDW